MHTRTCTYLLDEDGICRWIVSQQGVVPPHVRQCIGAQFVACLAFDVEGGLSGELRIGGRALFVRADDRMVLLRTGEILRVDDRRAEEERPSQPPIHQAQPPPIPRRSPSLPYRAKPPTFAVAKRVGEEMTITMKKPMFYGEADTQRQRR